MGLLPFKAGCRLARQLGEMVFYLWPSRRKIALRNLDRAYQDRLSQTQKKMIARKSFGHGAMSIYELFSISKILPKLETFFQFRGFEHIEKAQSKGKGVILVISHVGAWEYLSFLTNLKGVKGGMVVKKIKNPWIDREVWRCRSLTQATPILKDNSMKTVLARLKKNHVIAVLIDQWDGPDGLWVDFFGEKTSTTSIPSRLARKTGASLLPVFCVRRGIGDYEITIHEEVILPMGDNWETETTIRLNRILEEQIRECPDQWNWGHRRWKPEPSSYRMK